MHQDEFAMHSLVLFQIFTYEEMIIEMILVI